MPKYECRVKNLQNKTIKEVVDAKDEADLRKRVRDLDLVLIRYKELEDKNSGYQMKANDVAEFSRQMASMLDSGITVVRALNILKDRDFKPKLRLIYERLYQDTQGGLTLSEAMKLQGRAFPELFVNMMASGEASGQLELSAKKMADFYDKEYRLNGKIKTAMTYPIILLVFTVAVVMLVFTVILPQFFTLFEGIELPGITMFVLGVSGFLQKYWLVVIIGMLILIAFVSFLLTIYEVRLVVDRMKLNIIKIGGLLKIIYTARFARTLSSLYSSGLTMLNALDISSTILGNKYIESQFPEVIKEIRNGEPLSEAISKIVGFDKKLANTILIGEESGRLDSMLEAEANSFDYEAEMATGRLVQLIEPIMIVIMAVIIGTVMLSVIMPMMTLYNNVGNM